jgi:hypothetical protein
VLVAGSLAIAAVLLLRRDYILGLLIGGLALVRVTFLVGVSSRRRAARSARGAGRVGGNSFPGGTDLPYGADVPHAGPPREVLGPLRRPEYRVAAGVIGLGPSAARRAFEGGRSLAELAAGAGVPIERVVDAIVRDASAQIDSAVAEGRVAQQRAQEAKAHLPVWAGRLVNFHKGDLQRAQGWS